MEPLSALSVAAAVVQFAHFGYNVIKGSYDVYESSSRRIANGIEPATISHDLTRLLENAEAKLEDEWPRQPVPLSPTNDAGSPGDIFRRLCSECRDIKSALDEIFAKLVPRGNTRVALAASSFAVELKRISVAGEVDRLAERLSQVRQQTMTAILVLLLEEAKKSGLDIRQFAQQQVDIMTKLDRIDETTRNFSEHVVNFVGVRSSSNRSDVSKMVHYVLSDRWNAKDYLDRTQSVQHIGIKDSVYVDHVLQSLFFDSMGHREGQIPQRHAETFEWIFKEPRQASDGHPLWHNFPAWLEGGSSKIYWITGKPGAGKSTLIKFVADDERSLLLEILQQEKPLLSRIFPGRWFLLQIFDGEVDLPEPQLDELLVAFRALLSETAETLKLALIIDGLDEFEDDHRKLVGLLREANKKPWVKICTSSRPWNVFKDEYIHNPMLRLEKLTHEDIELYVRDRFRRSPGFQEFEVINPPKASSIVNDIVEKAEGVFLWVSVVSAACRSVNLDPYALTFWFGGEEDAVNDKVASMTTKYFSNAVASLGRRLVSRTGGLLEIFGSPAEPEENHVGYMHRTASDWVRDNWASVSSTTEGDFDPMLWVVRGESVRVLLHSRRHKAAPPLHGFWSAIKKIFEAAKYIKDTPSNRATVAHSLDRLDEHLKQAPSRRLRGSSSSLHWSNHDDFRPNGTIGYGKYSLSFDGHLSFLGFVARFPVVPYIKFKLEEDPAAFSTDPSYSGILQNIAFGSFTRAGRIESLLNIGQLDIQLRLELTELILQYGLCAHNVKKTRDMVVLARDIIKPAFSLAELQEVGIYAYFDQFAGLLDRYAPMLEGSRCSQEGAVRQEEAVCQEEAVGQEESVAVKSRRRRLLMRLKKLIRI
ncbi:hypothetical protein DL770_011821 [Monosporascus sp. CRB-9-2]|nr:hypothetical protein DL770_011821 [Monosporascus sp. CRB-9-2]